MVPVHPETAGSATESRKLPLQRESPTHILLQWTKENTLAALTILGILVYVVFSIPASYFYSLLGTTPSEVGMTYTTIVSDSTFGLLLIVAVLAIILYYVFMSLVFAGVFIKSMGLISAATANRKLTSEQFDEKLKVLQRAFRGREEDWQKVAEIIRRGREISEKEQRTREEEKELRKSGDLRIYGRMLRMHFNHTMEQFTPRTIKTIGMIIFAAVAIIVIILTLVAQWQSEEVEHGGRVFGTQIGLFDYHAQLVTVHPDAPSNTSSLEQLIGPLTGPHAITYLLGQNAQYLIVYSKAKDETVRVPVSEATVSSLPSSLWWWS
jgi:hypothetical protein